MNPDPAAERVQAVAISREFREIIDALPAFVWCAIPDGAIEFLNRRGLEYTGFSLEHIRGWSWRDTNILHPDDMEALFDAWQSIVASGKQGEIQARMRRFDGEYKWFLFRVAPLYDGGGRLIAWWGVDVEIDERKQAEDRLRRAFDDAQSLKNQFEIAIDTIPGLVWSALPDGHIDYLNQRWREYTGLSLEEASGWGWRTAIHPDDVAGLETYWRSVLASGQPGETEARLRRIDGVFRWFLFRGVPLYDSAGTLVKWYGQSTDIEDRKRAEALLAGEKRLLEMMAKGDSLPMVLESLCLLVEDAAPGCLCGILLVDPSGTHLHHGAAPSLPPSYNDAIHGRPIDPEAGPCGMAAYLKEQVIAADVTSDPRWDAYEWGALAVAHRLRACWSTPIMSSGGAILGTFALYWRQPQAPAPEHQNVIEQMTHLAAVAIERGRTAAALQESEQRLRLMADAIPEVIWLTALHPENVLYASPSFERVWGLPLADLYRNPRLWTETIHPDDRTRVIDTFTRWITRDGVDDYDIEFRIVQPTGTVRWIHERGVVIPDQNGTPYRVSGISTDITDRRQVEDVLRRSEANLARAQRLSATGSFSYVAATDELTLSEETHRICGFDPAVKVSPGAMRDRIHPEDLPLFLDMLRSTGRAFRFDCRVLLPDGSIRYLEVIADAVRDDFGHLVEWVGAIRDVTDRRRSEDALNEVRSDLAHVARVATLGEMTASIAHEINQPLGAIVNNANAGLRWLAASNVQEARESVALVVADGHRASEILAHIRAMVRKSPPHKQWVDINDAVGEVLTLAGGRAQKYGVAIESCLSDGIPRVHADRVQMQQVVLNLVINAIEAMSGTVDGLRLVTVDSTRVDETTVRVSVRDRGTGVDLEQLERLFETFYSTKPDGLGMGLAISRAIVKAHHGQLWATANPDRGATFQFTLPIAGDDRS
jgi:PAS domain S-box-containing protein